VVPRAWTHLLAIVADQDLAPATPMPPGWCARAAAARSDVELPIDMSDGEPGIIAHRPWAGHQEMPVDRAIRQTREAVYPLHGLDPRDPRD
jgi:acetoin utilization protein AcuC